MSKILVLMVITYSGYQKGGVTSQLVSEQQCKQVQQSFEREDTMFLRADYKVRCIKISN